MSTQVSTPSLATWRLKGIGLLRVAFGLIWAVDAWFKWQPDFVHNFEKYLTESQDGQPDPVQAWISFWMDVVNVNPHVFAYLVAIGETIVALGLIFGVFSNLTYFGGVLLSLVIWSTAEGFGGPYQAGSTDIGSAIIYVLVFVGLFLSFAGMHYGLDHRLTPLLGRGGFLASGSLKVEKKQKESETLNAQAADSEPVVTSEDNSMVGASSRTN